MQITFRLGNLTPLQAAEQFKDDIRKWAWGKRDESISLQLRAATVQQGKIQTGRAQAFSELIELIDSIMID
jgi:hypothetical protein